MKKLLYKLKPKITFLYGIMIILSGLYRFGMEPDGEKGLYFGLVMGFIALLAAKFFSANKSHLLGSLLGLLSALVVGGWFIYELSTKTELDLRMCVMSVASLLFVGVLLVKKPR